MTEYAPHAPLPAIRPVPVAAGPGAASLGVILGRIEEAIDAETKAIRSDPAFDLKGSNARKSRALYELTRALKGVTAPGPELRADILRLQAKLAANERAIVAHLAAVTEVAALIQGAIQNAEADGTYSSLEFGRV